MTKVTIHLSEAEEKILSARAKKNLLTLQEQVEDIVRRSCVNYKELEKYTQVNPDDRLIEIFSRQTRGRKRKKK